jgi:hypothetical protein
MLLPGEQARERREEHRLHFALAFLREPNYVIFVKASLLLSSVISWSGWWIHSVGAAYLGGDLVVGF